MYESVPVERKTRSGPAAGVEIVDFMGADVELVCPYFHQRFFTPDAGHFVCAGRFDGSTEVVLVEVATGEARRLTHGGANVHTGDLAPDGRTFYFTRDAHIRRLDLETGADAEWLPIPSPEGYQSTGSVHVNADGTKIAMGGSREHPSGVRTGCVWTVSTRDGTYEPVIERPFRIGHVQFSTSDPGLIMYCHETGGASPQRMWLARTDGRHPGPLFAEPGHPWVTHETFCRNGEWVVFVRHPEGLGRIRPDNTEVEALDAPGVWHPGPDAAASRIVYDTHAGDIRLLQPETGATVTIGAGEMRGGGPHPHPCFAPDDRTVIWTSSRGARGCPALAGVDSLMVTSA